MRPAAFELWSDPKKFKNLAGAGINSSMAAAFKKRPPAIGPNLQSNPEAETGPFFRVSRSFARSPRKSREVDDPQKRAAGINSPRFH